MELRHPETGHLILNSAACEAFVAYLAGLDDATLLSTGRDWAWLVSQGKGPEAEWKAERCRDEWRRRKARQHQ